MLLEPGSVIKPLLIAHALEEGITGLSQPHNCEKSGSYKIDDFSTIHDEHPEEYPTTAEVIIHSSNICMFKIAKKWGNKQPICSQKIWNIYPNIIYFTTICKNRFHCTLEKLERVCFANIAFGQGFHTTGLEIIKAYSILANGGFSVEPHILERFETPKKT